ncbi:MAG: dephospho-CoA kinase [Peptococcaceae bacterium]|nr:dephospho-CoA kinase [Peptococcaceae bacterium]
MIIGLTGNIGSGKSSVARHLSLLGAEVLDADNLAKAAVEPGSPGLDGIVATFGLDIIKENGCLDRKKMARIAFTNPQALAKLEAIIHPEVEKKIQQKIAEYQQGKGKGKALVIEVPLLFETGMNKLMDEVWLVTSGEETQIERVMDRSKLSREEVVKRMGNQLSQQEKCKMADRIIDNSGSISKTIQQIEEIWLALGY